MAVAKGVPEAVTAAKGLHTKLAEVMAEAETIPKNGTYPGQGNWKYVLVGDAANFIRKALGLRGVSMLPSAVEVVGETEYTTKNGAVMNLMTIRTTWTLVDGETGQTAIIQSIGSGADAGDKASPKAQTNAMKYALLMGFQLSTGDDPEQHDTSDRQSQVNHEPNLLGNIQKAGTFAKGNVSAGYGGEWRETPTGHAIGLRLKVDDKDVPQVLITGTTGEALYAKYPDPAKLIGMHVTVKGKLYGISSPGRATYYRLIIGEYPESDFIDTPDVRIPAPPIESPAGTEEPAGDSPPIAPGQVPFDLSDEELQ